jgi:tripartite-type tricarboxylate transporter receptor subunit TctC
MAPKGTTPDRLNAINEAARRYLDTPEAKQKYQGMGLAINPMTNDEFSQVVQKEVSLYRDLLGQLGLGKEK